MMENIQEELDGGTIDSTIAEEMDVAEKRILSIIQSEFPLEASPYAVIAKQVGLTEGEVLEKVREMRKRGIIRRIGANFQSAQLGFSSTLCSASVPEEKIGAFILEVNSYKEVTHNYLREHHYNIWFTCIARSSQQIELLLQKITKKTGITINNLPATRVYKIKVDFALR